MIKGQRTKGLSGLKLKKKKIEKKEKPLNRDFSPFAAAAEAASGYELFPPPQLVPSGKRSPAVRPDLKAKNELNLG